MSYAPRDVKNLNENMEFELLTAAHLLTLEERLTHRVRTDTYVPLPHMPMPAASVPCPLASSFACSFCYLSNRRRRGGLHHYFRDTFAENPV
jgi:hypothetical protein